MDNSPIHWLMPATRQLRASSKYRRRNQRDVSAGAVLAPASSMSRIGAARKTSGLKGRAGSSRSIIGSSRVDSSAIRR